ncbi:MAG: acetyl-CoA decarbonylase/synthase, complex subunit beta, partial [Methanolobus sp.]|nr:acetyl-CoA decarbonylase/synthase, complex subunit beta [Methanolobus sp.]
EAVGKGMNSFEQIAKAVMMLFKNELPFIEKVEATYITDMEEVEKQVDNARDVYKARDERTRGLHDEDVDTFYGCTLCASFAPTNVCVVTPDRISLCGAINWFDGRAAAKVDPEGPQFAIPKGELLDAESGEYSGVNEFAKKLSSGEYDRIKLHSFLEYPHTSCGCFEVVGFYIPEVDAIGWVDRDFAGTAPNGLQFSTMAGQTGGGKQVVGFLGIGVNYFRSPKFIQADGGWNRVVWMPKMLKEKVFQDIPEDLRDKIATEEDVKDIEALRNFLKEKKHPIIERWVEEEAEEEAKEDAPAQAAAPQAGFALPQMMQMPANFMPSAMPMMGSGSGGVRIILKNAKVTVDKIIIQKQD